MLKKLLYYIKTFIEKCILVYKNDKKFRKLNWNFAFFFFLVSIVAVSFCFLFNNKNCLLGFSPFLLLICFTRFRELFEYVSPDYIQPNMGKLPNKVGKYPVVIQYTPPKGLNPSEVGLLYNLESSFTNINCLLYKRQHEGIIDIEERKDGKLVLRRLKNISLNVPDYEKQYWVVVFGINKTQESLKKEVMLDINSEMDMKEIKEVHEKLLDYCVNHGRLLSNERWNSSGCLLACGLFFFYGIYSMIFMFGGETRIWVSSLLLFLVVGFSAKIINFRFNKGKEIYHSKKISRTDLGDKLYTHILGYKYWLETCEEEQIIKILEEDSLFKDKIVPYIIALRMNWKFLDRKFSRHK